ncbi:MAG: precorrin-2 dehydrogenase/sirohydrochlorin ferrochelatase family protein [Chloroflexota bacterium]
MAPAPAHARRGTTRYYPVFLRLEGRLVLVVGGGVVAERKIRSLLDCAARVRAVTLEATPAMYDLAERHDIELILDTYDRRHLDGAFLAVASTNDAAVNRQVFTDAEARGLPCNVVDVPELCSFIVPATVTQGDLTIAISTNGKSPSFAKLAGADLRRHFGPEYATYLRILGALRGKVKRLHPSTERREEVWARLHRSDILNAIRDGDGARIREIVRACL